MAVTKLVRILNDIALPAAIVKCYRTEKRELLRVTGQLADIPAGSRSEGPVREALEDILKPHVNEMWTDAIGNLYTLKRGKRPGLVMLAAHQDKIVETNILGTVAGEDEGGYLMSPKEATVFDVAHSLNRQLDLLVNNRPVRLALTVPRDVQRSAKGMARELRATRESYQERIGELQSGGIIPSPDDATLKLLKTHYRKDFNLLAALLEEGVRLLPHSGGVSVGDELVLWPRFSVSWDGIARGKLDDSLGLGIITYLNQRLEPGTIPDLLTVYTVQEETGFRGAAAAAREIAGMEEKPSRIVVVDTTPLMPLGSGAVVYRSCGGIDFDTRYVADIIKVAEENHIRHRAIFPASINDSAVFADALGDIATIAVEVPIAGMHSSMETSAARDIIHTYELLKAYLTTGDVSPLEGVRHCQPEDEPAAEGDQR